MVDPLGDDKTYGFGAWTQAAYERACARNGLPALSRVGGPTTRELFEAAGRLLDDDPGVTALIAPQEQSVIGIIKAAQVRDIRIPDRLSVIGMVGELMAEVATPPLTTISFPAHEMGEIAAQMMLRRIDDTLAPPEQVYVTPTLVLRGSTARPAW